MHNNSFIATVRRFVLCDNGQICGGDFAKFCGLLRMYELYLVEYNYILPRTLENLRAKVFNKVGSLVQFHGPLIHLYGPICKNVGVTTYLHILWHSGRSKNLWGQKYICLLDLEFKHEWSSLRLLVDSKLSEFVNPPLWANL